MHPIRASRRCPLIAKQQFRWAVSQNVEMTRAGFAAWTRVLTAREPFEVRYERLPKKKGNGFKKRGKKSARPRTGSRARRSRIECGPGLRSTV